MQMNRVPLMKSVMTPFPYSIDIDADLLEARALMDSHGIRHLPVKENGQLIGVVAESDVNLALDPEVALGAAGATRVRDVCVRGAYIVDLMERLDTVLLNMAERHIGSALVMKSGRLAGIFTSTDACRYFGEWLRTKFPLPYGDGVA